jgi:hypothetical protein
MTTKGFVGTVFIVVGIANLVANLLWFHTGDIHRPQLHVVMRGGWFSFWFTTVMGCGFLIAGIVLVLRSKKRS